jgi:hypothetical protein
MIEDTTIQKIRSSMREKNAKSLTQKGTASMVSRKFSLLGATRELEMVAIIAEVDADLFLFADSCEWSIPTKELILGSVTASVAELKRLLKFARDSLRGDSSLIQYNPTPGTQFFATNGAVGILKRGECNGVAFDLPLNFLKSIPLTKLRGEVTLYGDGSRVFLEAELDGFPALWVAKYDPEQTTAGILKNRETFPRFLRDSIADLGRRHGQGCVELKPGEVEKLKGVLKASVKTANDTAFIYVGFRTDDTDTRPEVAPGFLNLYTMALGNPDLRFEMKVKSKQKRMFQNFRSDVLLNSLEFLPNDEPVNIAYSKADEETKHDPTLFWAGDVEILVMGLR